MIILLLIPIAIVLTSCSPDIGIFDPIEFEVPNSPTEKPLVELEPTFESIKANILEPKCVRCHRAGGKVDDIPLVSFEDLTESPLEIVIPGNPDESTLMMVFQEDSRKYMPPRDSLIEPLTAAQIETVREWILNGAQK